jgi:hypothetical protein
MSAILHLPSSLYGGGSSLRRRGIRAEAEIRDRFWRSRQDGSSVDAEGTFDEMLFVFLSI